MKRSGNGGGNGAWPFLNVGGEGEGRDATVFRCGLCGSRFTHGSQACPTCPVNAGCDLVQCPNCGYQFPRGSRLVSWLQKIFGRWRGAVP